MNQDPDVEERRRTTDVRTISFGPSRFIVTLKGGHIFEACHMTAKLNGKVEFGNHECLITADPKEIVSIAFEAASLHRGHGGPHKFEKQASVSRQKVAMATTRKRVIG